MPATWADALAAVGTGITTVMDTVTGSTLLTTLSFGFAFVMLAIKVVKRLIKIGK